ncbi:MAG: phospholipase D family protein [Deltaproteobacteria bacterium]|nr:phospholipase D family protein [Deltaproteobacteria bacterium]
MKKIFLACLMIGPTLAWGFSDPCFSPGGRCAQKLVMELNAAKKSVFVMAYSFTHPEIGAALARCKKAGLDVRVIVNEKNRNERSSVVPLLQAAGIPVTFDRDFQIMHNKVMIIDDQLVVQGSFNFTKSADLRNGENLNFIQAEPAVVDKYKADFFHHQQHSQP